MRSLKVSHAVDLRRLEPRAPDKTRLFVIDAVAQDVERAARALVSGLKGTDNNREFLIKSARKAAQQPEYIA